MPFHHFVVGVNAEVISIWLFDRDCVPGFTGLTTYVVIVPPAPLIYFILTQTRVSTSPETQLDLTDGVHRSGHSWEVEGGSNQMQSLYINNHTSSAAK